MKLRPKQLDLAVPYGKPMPEQQTHTVQPPPSDDQLTREIAEILATGAALHVMAAGVQTLVPDLGLPAIMAALGLVGRGTAHKPNASPGSVGLLKSTTAMRSAAHSDLYYRAAYFLNAARRIHAQMVNGSPVKVALAKESPYYRQHEAARKGRLQAVTKAAAAASMYGDLVGWYLNPLLNNEIECIRADGNNFHASEGTIIGYPGAVHPNCGCVAGPPIEGAGMVNDAVASILRTPSGRKVKLRVA